MSDALFLPRELFQTAPKATTPVTTPVTAPGTTPATPPAAEPQARSDAPFASGEAVAADLMQSLLPTGSRRSAGTERRRKPRPADAVGVDLYIA